jgi:quercetin dioxygenase-like cupin family protein
MTLHDWQQIPTEEMNPQFKRKVIHTEQLTVAQLELKKGGHVPLHHHVNEQLSMVHTGRLLFHIAGREVEVGPGESLQIPPNVPHDVDVLEDCTCTDIFTPRREDWLSGSDAYLRGK